METNVLTSQVWPNGTEVCLYEVPWDSSYRDVVAWNDEDTRDAWFAEHRGFSFPTKFHWLRPAQPIVVECPYSTAYQYNYLSVRNPANPVTAEGTPRTLYYFITDAQPQNTGTCTLTVQLDVATTYGCSVDFGTVYVESGHIGIANENLGKLDTLAGEALREYADVPEGMDCGAEYETVAKDYFNLLDEAPKIVIVSTADLTADPGTTAEPNLTCATGQVVGNLPSGCNVYSMEKTFFFNVMQQLSKKSWVGQCIVSISTFPSSLLVEGDTVQLFGKSGDEYAMHKVEGTRATDFSTPDYMVENVFDKLSAHLSDAAKRYVKLFAYPYSVIELDGFNGNPVQLKPQLLHGRRLDLSIISCALAPFARIGIFPQTYNCSVAEELTYAWNGIGGGGTGKIQSGDFLKTCVWLTDFPQFSIVNNMYFSYLASTAHTRAYNYESAGWGLTSANASARTGYNNTQAQQATAYDAYGRTANAQRLNFTDSQALSGANLAVNAIGNAASGNYAGAAVSGALGVAQLAVSGNNFNRSMAASDANASSAYQTNRQVADANYELASFQNQGNYENAIRGIQAAVQDAALTPPSTAGQMGGQGFNWDKGLVGVCISYKRVAGAAADSILGMFERYGYQVHRFVNFKNKGLSGLMCMSRYTYIKTQGASVREGDGTDAERQAISGMLNRGVTLWASPDRIGRDLTDNDIRPGFSY